MPRRLFIAIRPQPAAIDDLTDYVSDLHVARPWRRCVELDLWHVTVAFIGAVEAPDVAKAAGALRAAATGTGPFTLRLAGGGRFGRGRYNIVYAGLDGEVDRLVKLALDTRAALRAAGLPHDRKQYRPHLTMASAAARLSNCESAEDLMSLRRYRGPEWPVTEVGLYRSVTGAVPAYHPVESVTL